MRKPHEDWFEMAHSDLSFAKIGLKEEFYSQVCFLSHQVVEKTLKGCLLAAGKAYPKTHKLVDLFTLLHASWLSSFKNKIKLLDEFYIPTRYPDGIPGGLATRLSNVNDAKEAFSIAQEIYKKAVESIF